MKPIQLTIQAFGSYGERAVIDFTKPTQNLFLVTGDTGAGKTTIFDAIRARRMTVRMRPSRICRASMRRWM